MWRALGVSTAMAGKPVCQDSHQWAMMPDAGLIMTVADGAGSAALAEVGSSLASRTALDHLRERLTTARPTEEQDWHALLLEGMNAARTALQKEAAKRETPLKSLATTLIIMVLTDDCVAVAQIGDGMVFAADTCGEIIALTMPHRGEYANETVMLTSHAALEHVQMMLWTEKVTGVAAMTDGLLPITTTLPFYQPFAPFFKNLFAFLQDTGDTEEGQGRLKRFLLSDRVQNGTEDDLTLVLAVPTGVEAQSS